MWSTSRGDPEYSGEEKSKRTFSFELRPKFHESLDGVMEAPRTSRKCLCSFRSSFSETDLSWTATPTGWSVLLIRGLFSAWSVGSGAFAQYKTVTTSDALETLQKYPITHAQFRPSIYMEALHEGNLRSFSFPNLKRCFVAGEPTNELMVRRWKEETGVEMWNYYGQTETVCCYR